MKENNSSQLGDYDMPFCEQQQYTHRSQFKFKSFDQLIPPKLPEILDIYSVVALQFLFYSSNVRWRDYVMSVLGDLVGICVILAVFFLSPSLV